MAEWIVKLYSESTKGDSSIQGWLDERNAQQLKSIAKEIKLLERCGNILRLPHSKPLGDGLFELRERTYGYRVYYTFLKKQTIVLLHAGNKSTQQKDIRLARGRLLKVECEETVYET